MEAARVPEHLIKKPAPLVRDMPAGETWHIVFTDVIVVGGRAYLDPAGNKREAGVETVMLRRDQAGFHVVVNAPSRCGNIKFVERKRLTTINLIPIVSLTEEASSNRQ